MMNAQKEILMPPDIQALVAWDGNSKDKAKHTFRIDGANEYIVNYTDGYAASQAVGSSQPLWTPEGWYFDGSGKKLVTDNIPDVVFAVVVGNSTRDFVGYDCFISSFQGGVPYASIMGAIDSTIFELIGGTYTQSDVRINNVVGTNFAPNNVFKVISAKFGTKVSNVYDIGSNAPNGSLQGYIKRIILFHTEPNSTQKASLQSYLEDYHSL
jgi:hypothetical protein